MKSALTIIAALMTVALAVNQEHLEQCSNETHVRKEIINGLIQTLDFLEDDDQFNEYAFCSARKKGNMKANGEVDWEELERFGKRQWPKLTARYPEFVKRATPQKISEMIKYCKNLRLVGNSPGQTGIMVHNCGVKFILRGTY